MAILIVIVMTSLSDGKEVPFSQEDRDRLVRLEEGQKGFNQRIEGVEKNLNIRIDDLKRELKEDLSDLKTFILWGFGILFGGMGILIGFVIWDRRTALAPVVRRYKELEEKEDLLEKAIKEYAKNEPKLAEILKSIGLL